MSAKDSYWFQSPSLSWLPVHVAGGVVACTWVNPMTKQPLALPPGELSAAQLQTLKRAVHSTTCEHSDDLVAMEDVTEGSLLHNLRMRFASDLIYTNVGSTLISVNPFKPVPLYTEELLDRYSRLPAASLPPHIFATSALCVRDLQSHRRNQSVVISGESGSGKSEATKLLIMFFTNSSSKDKDASSAAIMSRFLSNVQSRDSSLPPLAAHAGGSSADITTKILEAGPVLESLGNAKTVRNNNSSRFGKWISLVFDPSNHITSCSISCYLLEKSRIVQKGPGERNFHSLYQLCAGADPAFKSKYGIADASSHEYTRSNVMTVPNMDDALEWRQLLKSLEILSFDEAERDGFARILAGVLLLGDVSFKSSAEGNATVAEPARLTGIAAALGVEVADLNRVLTTKTFSASRRSIHTLNLAPEAAADARNALSKMLYAALFEYAASRIDDAMSEAPQRSAASGAKAGSNSKIGILDIFGYENFTTNSLEQLCINLANERIHQLYNHHTFDGEKSLFASEGVVAPSSLNIAYVDNSSAIEAICGRASIFSILDDECNVPKGSDENIAPAIGQLALRLSTGVHWNKDKPLLSVAKIGHDKFSVAHYAGDVQYTTALWLDKNRDALNTDISIVMSNSSVAFIVAAIDCLTSEPPVAASGKLSLKDAASMVSGKKSKSSLTKKFSAELVDLVSSISSGELHFIRCIKPNHVLAASNFDGNFINTQLRYSGMMAAVDVRRHGFPVRMPLREFQHQFQPLVHSSHASSCHTLLAAFGFSQEDCQVGRSMVFMKDAIFHSLRARLLVIQSQRLVTMQCSFRCAHARRVCKRRRWAIRSLQSRSRCVVAMTAVTLKLVTLYLNDAVLACDETRIIRYLSMAQDDQEGVAAARYKLIRITETREFIQGLKQYHTCEDVGLLESVVNESRKLEVANHEAVRLVAAQLDRAKRIVIVQQAILSAISRSNISDLDISIATAQQLVDPDRDWLIDANRSRRRLEVQARIRAALESRELVQLQEAERLAETVDDIAPELVEEIHVAHTIVKFEHDLAVAVDRQDIAALKPLLEKATSLDHRAEFLLHKAGILMNAYETKQQLSLADKITDVAELCKVISRAQRHGITESDTNLRAAVNQFKSLVLQKVTPEALKEMQIMASNGLLTNSIRNDEIRGRLTKIAKDAADRLSGKSALAGEELLSLERQLGEAVASKNIDKLRFLLFQAQRSGADSSAVRGARSSLQSVLELSNARKALAALIEQDADGYTITAAIEHAQRVGVDAEVLNAASVIAQERAQKRLLIQNLKTGLAADPARQRAILQPFVEQARSLGISHDIVDAAQAKLRALAEEEKKSAAIMQAPLLELIDKFIALVSNPESVVPNSLRDSLVLFAQQYSMHNCFLCLQPLPPPSSAAASSATDDRPSQPLTSLPTAATASAIFIGRCIVWFSVNKGDSFSASLLSEILKTVLAGPVCLRTEAWMFLCKKMASASDPAIYSRLALLAFVFARNFTAEAPALSFAISALLSGIISSSESAAVASCRHPPSLQLTQPLLIDALHTTRLNVADAQRLPPRRCDGANLAGLLPVSLLPLAKLDALDA